MTAHVDTIILGAGFSGIAAAIALREAGLDDFIILERASSTGGTWRDNIYPGAACDTPSHLYCLSRDLSPDWSHVYARQPEIARYLDHTATAHDLHARITFHCNVLHARFDSEEGCWHLSTSSPDGSTRAFSARFIISGIGELRDPFTPALPGLEGFAGEVMHSARWRPEVVLDGKRVGVVGSGASAIQIVPQIARQVDALHIYQRTPPWVIPRHDRAYSAALKRVFSLVPLLMKLYRWKLFLEREARYPIIFARSWLRPFARRMALANLHAHIPDDASRAQLTPSYEFGCKRVLISDDWYPTVARPHVHVHTDAIEGLDTHGVMLDSGAHQELDVLIFCTGFQVERPLGELHVEGPHSASLNEAWRAQPGAFLGICAPEAPNMFFLLGPNTGLGHNSVVMMIEAQVRYVVQALEHMRHTTPRATLRVKPARYEAFLEEMRTRHADQVWASGCRSWYRTAEGTGENFAIWPGSTLDYMWRVRRFDPEDYTIQRHVPNPS